MKSKTQIRKQLIRKTSPYIVQTVREANKNEKWIKVAEILSGSTRKRLSINLDEINEQIDNIKEHDKKIVFPGKVLSEGNIDKKIKIIALNFSEHAKEKLIKKGCEVSNLFEEIKKNPDAKNIIILRTKEYKENKK